MLLDYDTKCTLHCKIYLSLNNNIFGVNFLELRKLKYQFQNLILLKFFKCIWVVYNKILLTQKNCHYDFHCHVHLALIVQLFLECMPTTC